mgnify:CR=1 FL=1
MICAHSTGTGVPGEYCEYSWKYCTLISPINIILMPVAAKVGLGRDKVFNTRIRMLVRGRFVVDVCVCVVTVLGSFVLCGGVNNGVRAVVNGVGSPR